MKIIKQAMAGTLESSDLLVKVDPTTRVSWTSRFRARSSNNSASESGR